NRTASTAFQIKEQLESEKKILLSYKDELSRFETKNELLRAQIKAAIESIRNFRNQNSTLIANVKEEAVLVEVNIDILKSYDKIIPALKKYTEELPAELTKNLNEKTCDFYNSLNRDDLEAQRLNRLELPSTGTGD